MAPNPLGSFLGDPGPGSRARGERERVPVGERPGGLWLWTGACSGPTSNVHSMQSGRSGFDNEENVGYTT